MGADQAEKRRREGLDRLTRVMEGVGFPHSMATVYSALVLAEGEGLSTSEIVKELGVSKASISNATQFLVRAELVERYRVRGTREAHYRILKGTWGPLLTRKFSVMTAVTKTVQEAMDYTESELARERLQEMYDVYSFFEEQYAHILKEWNEREKR